ncbi:6833_t:CDS:2 [Entrophospora sp. SA101]|nr:6833_t:CDS:2 [Entrophospora sp. SA101]
MKLNLSILFLIAMFIALVFAEGPEEDSEDIEVEKRDANPDPYYKKYYKKYYKHKYYKREILQEILQT